MAETKEADDVVILSRRMVRTYVWTARYTAFMTTLIVALCLKGFGWI